MVLPEPNMPVSMTLPEWTAATCWGVRWSASHPEEVSRARLRLLGTTWVSIRLSCAISFPMNVG